MKRFLSFLLLNIGFGLALAGSSAAFTPDEINTFFSKFDMDGDGKVTRDEYNTMKVQVFFIYQSDTLKGIRYEQTKISRQAFDTADKDGNGLLSSVEILNALPFTNIAKNNSTFDKTEFSAFIKSIER